jgi:hypothetical protein
LWPRYYFDFEVAKSEVIAWLHTRKQFVEGFTDWFETAGQLDGKCCSEAIKKFIEKDGTVKVIG